MGVLKAALFRFCGHPSVHETMIENAGRFTKMLIQRLCSVAWTALLPRCESWCNKGADGGGGKLSR